MRLEVKVALVTGAANGIGFAVAALFDCQGAVVVTSDVISWSDDARCHQLGEAWPPPYVLMNNAGIIAYEPLDKPGMKDCLKMIAVDQTGAFVGMRGSSSRYSQAAGGFDRQHLLDAAMTYPTVSGSTHTPLTDAQAPDLNDAVIAMTSIKRGGSRSRLPMAATKASYVTGVD